MFQVGFPGKAVPRQSGTDRVPGGMTRDLWRDQQLVVMWIVVSAIIYIDLHTHNIYTLERDDTIRDHNHTHHQPDLYHSKYHIILLRSPGTFRSTVPSLWDIMVHRRKIDHSTLGSRFSLGISVNVEDRLRIDW